MVIVDILPALAEAVAVQHRALRSLFSITAEQLPDDLAAASLHASLTAYAAHLPTDCGGCAFANVLLTAPAASCGAAISAQPVLHLSTFHRDIAADPGSWLLSGVLILSEPAVTFYRIAALPAWFTDPTLYPDRHRAFVTAVTDGSGRADFALIDAASRLHPQAVLARTQNRQLFADIVGDAGVDDLVRAVFRASAVFNAGRFLIPFYITRENKLATEDFRTSVQFRLLVPLSFLGRASRCLPSCRAYGPGRGLVIPGAFGPYYITANWHGAGIHMISCCHGPFSHARHESFRHGVLDGLAKGGAAISKEETFISPADNKRADGCLWHIALGARGVAVDVTIWSDFTLARLPRSASNPLYVLLAAEKYKTTKYEALCDALNLDFAALAANPLGGFSPTLLRVWRTVWDARVAQARLAGLPTRPIASAERRCLERISAGMARHLHRAIFQHATSRYVATTVQPADVDGDAHVPMDT